MPYDHKNPTKATVEDTQKAVGSRAMMLISGTITEARESDAGPFVMFTPDERWGFTSPFGGDLELFHVFPEESS